MPKNAKNRQNRRKCPKLPKMLKKCEKCSKLLKNAKILLKIHILIILQSVRMQRLLQIKKNRTFCKIISKKKKISIGNDIPLRAVTQYKKCV